MQAELKDTLIRQNNISESIRNYRNLLRNFPENNFLRNQLFNSYRHQAGYYLLTQQYDKSKIFYKKAYNLKPNSNATDLCLQAADSGVKTAITNKILSHNLNAIVQICKEKQIELIFSGYPLGVPEAMKKIADLNDVILVDHQATFECLLQQYPIEKYFVSKVDMHCSKAGYLIMAKNIASIILNIYKQAEIKEEG